MTGFHADTESITTIDNNSIGKTIHPTAVNAQYSSPKLKLPISFERALRLEELEKRRNELSKQIEASKKKSTKKELLKQKTDLDAEHAALAPPSTLVMQELPTSRETKMFLRGSFLNKGTAVTANVPRVMNAFPQDAPKNRLGFAMWLVDPSNPLTARVAVDDVKITCED